MKILKLSISNWRNFKNIEIKVPEESTLVCLIGENGTGKSNIIELISAASHRLGISPGVNIPRGDPFSEMHSFSITIKIYESLESIMNEQERQQYPAAAIQWDGTITVKSVREENGTHRQSVLAGGSGDENMRVRLGTRISDIIRERKETHYLSLDSDRAYPPLAVQPHEFASALEQDWESPQWMKQRAFLPARTMYDDWIKYFLATEGQISTQYVQNMRKAKSAGQVLPEFVDIFEPYKAAVKKVLPHLEFTGVNTKQKAILFDSAGLELKFSSLSGGEREIAFIIGQIERFKLRHGLLLIDEPELHLNPDLLRNWIAYLRDTIVTGQVWISTHSLEAAEAAGPETTFVLERTPETRLVESASPLSARPVLAVLSAAVGSPAFSLSRLRFIFIEGDRQGREKEKYYSIFGDARYIRFIEGGGCNEVNKKLSAVRELAAETQQQLHTGGIIDRDFRTDAQVRDLTTVTPVFVLGLHEIENVFLQPEAIEVIRKRSGIVESADTILRDSADQFAGMWVLLRSLSRTAYSKEVSRSLRKTVAEIKWTQFQDNLEASVTLIADQAYNQTDAEYATFKAALIESVEAFKTVRESKDLWKECMGKEVLSTVPNRLGLRNHSVLEKQVLKLWVDGDVAVPKEVEEFKKYIDQV